MNRKYFCFFSLFKTLVVVVVVGNDKNENFKEYLVVQYIENISVFNFIKNGKILSNINVWNTNEYTYISLCRFFLKRKTRLVH